MSGSFSPLTLILFIRIILAPLDSLHVHINFRITLSISKKKIDMLGLWIELLESTDQYVKN
jgi:hypothetical protein